MKIFYLPDLGEGLPDAEIHEWHVKVGDTVKKDDNLVSVETAKALIDVPSPFDGKIAILHGDSGDIIKTGSPLVSFEGTAENREDAGTVVGKLESHAGILEEKMMIIKSKHQEKISAKATPTIKALALKLNVDITTITGTGNAGMITAADVKSASQHTEPKEGFTLLKGFRRAMFHTMSLSREETCPVSVFDDADLSAWQDDTDISARMVRALVVACTSEPALNATLDTSTQSQKFNTAVHVGIAMDTEEGLFVPVIHHAEKLSLKEIRQKINEYKKKVHDRTIASENLHGATITLSNFGKFAGRYATTVIVPPQVAIIATGPKRVEPKVKNDVICACQILPLSLTFDHRAITGGEATRFMGILLHDLEKDS